MAGVCCDVVGENDAAAAAAAVEPSSRSSRRRRLDLLQFHLVADVAAVSPALATTESSRKRRKVGVQNREGENAVENSKVKEEESLLEIPKFGMTSVCGRRRDMEDAVSIRPFFRDNSTESHFFGVFDGHGCSHVATRCKHRLHEIVKEEIQANKGSIDWKEIMERSYDRMDKEIQNWNEVTEKNANCKCELQAPHCDAVGSTAVVSMLTKDKIIIANCGDSRAVLCRKGVAIPLSSDHKPDRPDELVRIEAAGGRVIYWDGARVLGVLAMSRAIGDNYLKPYVIPEPEVTVINRTDEDECLILASDGLWDVVSNDTACGVAKMCLRGQRPQSPPGSPGFKVGEGDEVESSDKACYDASILLTKLALARQSADNVSVVVVDLRKNQQVL